jgi:hypothetical protein
MPSDNWTEAIPLSSIDDRSALNPEIEVYKNNVHVVWEENYNIYYRRSEDYGETWSDIILLVSNSSYNATESTMCLENNNIYLCWVNETKVYNDDPTLSEVQGVIYFKSSLNNGDSWSKDIKINGNHSHFPHLAVESDVLHLVWSENHYYLWPDQYLLYNFDIYYLNFTTNDFSSPIFISQSIDSVFYNPDSHSFRHVNLAVEDNAIYIVWSDGYKWSSRDIFFVKSSDGGNTWNEIKNITKKSNEFYLNPLIAVNKENIFVCFFREVDMNNKSVVFINSIDGGIYWNNITILDKNCEIRYNVDGLDIKGENEKIIVVWLNDGQIQLRTSSNYGNTWNSITQITDPQDGAIFPKLEADNGYLHSVWLSGSHTRDLYYKHYFKNTPLEMIPFNKTIHYEDQNYKQKLKCANADGEVTWNIESNASWLSLDKINNSIIGTPTNEDVGTYWVKITASDSYADSDELNLTLTVVNVNDAPAIEGAPKNITVTQTEPIKLDLSFYIYDIDNPTSDLSLQSSSKYIKIEVLELYLDYRNAGIMYENVTINVTDGKLASTNHYLEVEILLVDAWNVEIEDYSPKGNNVSIFSNISITFNRLMNHTSCENAFKLAPSIYGEFEWNHNILIFYPVTFLKYSTSYIVSIDTTATSIEGHLLNTNFSWIFTTEKMTGIDSDNDGYPDEIDAFPTNPDYYLDTDKDGMPDAWEDKFGLNKFNSTDALLDPDDDGKTNKEEFEDDTDPWESNKEPDNEERDVDYMIFIIITILIILILIILLIIKINKKKKT